MATTTTNFGWDIPQSTDLVKDGATAIAALGQDIDTALVDLKGGTTGQVLSKASNTDLDYTWVTQDDANAIQNSIVDAKGDLISATGNDVPARLAVGNNGETLVADSSASVGLRYQEPKAGNPVLNSSFQIWQRGTSTTDTNGAGKFIADRWQIYSGASGRTYSRQLTNDTTNLPNIQYCMRVARDSGNTATNQLSMGQNFETVNSIPFAGKSVVLSFYARAGANYSATSSALGIKVVTGTGTDQNGFYNGYTGETSPINTSVTLTTTWQRFSVTGTIGATTTELLINFAFSPTGTAGANDYYEITGVQFEVGSVATPFKTYAATLAGESSACERYYWRVTSGNVYGILGFANGATSTTAYGSIMPNTTMRAMNSITSANIALLDGPGTLTAVTLAIQSNYVSTNLFGVVATAASGLTANRPYLIQANNTGAAYIAIEGEL